MHLPQVGRSLIDTATKQTSSCSRVEQMAVNHQVAGSNPA